MISAAGRFALAKEAWVEIDIRYFSRLPEKVASFKGADDFACRSLGIIKQNQVVVSAPLAVALSISLRFGLRVRQ